MTHIAIIEDVAEDRKLLCSFIERYGKENGIEFKITEFANAITFLTNYKPGYDMVFIDIQMPHMNGMEAAEKLREIDSAVPIVFITNMANFAVQGYSVNAADFVVKPVTYYNFSVMLDKVMRISRSRSPEIVLKTADGAVRLRTDDIIYIEVMGHKTIYHLDGRDIEIWDTLKSQEEKLSALGFARCNKYCIANLKYVDKISGDVLTIYGAEITITRTRKKQFMQGLVEYYGKKF